eukprot:TRINITY_DN18059_c0_g1_i1.p1 TRINITY_DN18059_c0_g1~~TRINITY_DN18059_c0_g1_i1.p1  ORF type:complete len:312 (+),score=23.29 TRINITY_DN18059_c0_g1_i1:999-1934(+)
MPTARLVLFVRDAMRAQTTLAPLFAQSPSLQSQIEWFVGDLKSPESIENFVRAGPKQHLDCIVYAAGVGHAHDGGPRRSQGLSELIDYRAVEQLAQHAAKTKVAHFIFISSCFVTRPSDLTSIVLNYLFDDTLKWKLRGENALRRSGVPFTIIRPGKLVDRSEFPTANSVALQQGDTGRGSTLRSDIATLVCMTMEFESAATSVSVEAFSIEDPARSAASPIPWREMLSVLVKEREPMPDWEQDEDVPQCRGCATTFWFWSRRHHCRACGRIFCYYCADYMRAVPKYGLLLPVRVCRDCFPGLQPPSSPTL